MIPQEKIAAVSRGLEEAFGTATIDDVRRITRGLSSDLVFRIVVKSSPYLLRIMTRINEQMDPVRIFAAMATASEAGITPRVRYTNPEDGISITDFVEAVPLSTSQALHLLPRTLSTLHGLSPFPKEFNYTTAYKTFVWRFRNASLLGEREIEEAFARHHQLCVAYPRLEADMVSCHMDLKPDNILFDGNRVWLVDWQAAFINDRYFDLAVAASFIASAEADESTSLEQYFGRPPDEYQRARFFLMRQAVHMLSAAVFLLIGSMGKQIERVNKLPSFEEFHRGIWAGEVNLADKDQQIISGLVHWNRLLNNIRQPRFDEALRIVASRHPEHSGKLFPVQ